MSEESTSLLAGNGTPTPSEELTEIPTEVTPWYVSEGIQGEGDKPAFLQDKYKSLSAQAEAYPELAKKFGGFTGAPDEYELSMPDGVTGDFIEDNPLMDQFQTWAKDNQLNQESFTGLLHLYLQNESESLGTNRELELAAIGDNAKSRLQNINDYAKANLSEEDYDGVLSITSTAAGVKAVEALIAKTRGFQVPVNNAEIATGPTHEEIKARMSDPRYAKDSAFRKETSQMYDKLFGKEPKKTTVG